VLIFTVGITFFNLSVSTFTNPAAVIDVRNAVARSMVGVRLRDVGFEGYNFTKVSDKIVNNFESSRSPSDGLGKAHLTVSKSQSSTKVTLNVTASLIRVGATNGTVAFQSLVSQLDDSYNSGALLSYSRSFTPLATATTVILDPLTKFTATALLAPVHTLTFSSVAAVKVSVVTRSSITLSVILVNNGTGSNGIIGGTLYCAAFDNGTSPSSTGSVKSAVTDGAHSRGAFTAIPSNASFPLTLKVHLTGLNSVQSYSTFCYVESSVRAGSTLSQVLATRRVTITLCCKLISYVSSPASVFGDISKYAASSSSLYLFSYLLSDSPLIGVTITPIVFSGSVISSDVSVLPAQIAFSNSSLLAGRFYLSAKSSVSGSYNVKLKISGANALQFNGQNTSVAVLSSLSKTPAPSILSSKFSNSGQEVLVTFNKPTDLAGISAAIWPCTGLFGFIGAAITSCKWVNASAVIASFGVVKSVQTSVMYLSPGANVTLRAGLLRAYCTESVPFCLSNPTANSARVSTQAPSNPSRPTVVVSAPGTLGACSNLTLDATGSYGNGGRLYTSVVWTVTSTSTGIAAVSAAAIQTYLNTESTSYQVYQPITVDSSLLTRATYTITLALTNFLGLRSSEAVVITLSADRDLPSVSIIGPLFQNMPASQPLTILSAASISACPSKVALAAVKYAWTVKSKNVDLALKTTSLDPSKFTLPAYALAFDKTYVITITASSSTSSSFASTTVYVASGAIIAAVVGGYTRSSPVNKDLVLDASISHDSNISPTAVSTLMYKVFFFRYNSIVPYRQLFAEI
jgi:REJ domain